jgi:hypothetical protein
MLAPATAAVDLRKSLRFIVCSPKVLIDTRRSLGKGEGPDTDEAGRTNEEGETQGFQAFAGNGDGMAMPDEFSEVPRCFL